MPTPSRLDPRASYLLLLLLLAAGCNQRPATYPADGAVVDADGTPLPGNSVEFRMVTSDGAVLCARSPIDEQGKFSLSTFVRGDGAPAGDYRAIVVEDFAGSDGDVSRGAVAPKAAACYRSYDTSDLQFTVAPDRENHFVLKLDTEH